MCLIISVMAAQDFQLIIIAWIVLGLVLIPFQFFITAPFGRHVSRNWGPMIDNRTGWMIMEVVSPTALWLSYFLSGANWSLPTLFLLGTWSAHYINRSLIYPLRTNTRGKQIPLFIMLSSIIFNGFNGWSNGTYFGVGWGGYTNAWFGDPRFVVGLAIMVIGAAINLHSDNILLRLRSGGENGYRIPHGGLFDRVSCPNFLGEIIEWAGFAIACWNLPAMGFAIWTAANLIPRAASHHRWYKCQFENYPKKRHALFPGIF